MIKIEYPQKKPSTRAENGKESIFCICRKKWVVLTPEEWVRQNFLLYLTESLAYPLALVTVEKKLQVGERLKRYDIVVHNRQGQPVIVVECKEMNQPLNALVLEQVLCYNTSLEAPCLLITNGVECFGFQKNEKEFHPLKKVPPFLP
ncbi:MAG: type I restriction enzyme HsdR N-terminal domain-containing protein [Ferruginibacter sp.]